MIFHVYHADAGPTRAGMRNWEDGSLQRAPAVGPRARPTDPPVGEPDRGADRGRDLDRLRHPRLPRPPGGLDQEPGRRAHLDPVQLPPGSRGPPPVLAAADQLTRLARQAQRRPPRPGRSRAPGPPGRARHPEHRRAPPEGRQRARTGSSSCTAPCTASCAGSAARKARCSPPSTGSGRASPTLGASPAAGSSSRPRSASARTSIPTPSPGPSGPPWRATPSSPSGRP